MSTMYMLQCASQCEEHVVNELTTCRTCGKKVNNNEHVNVVNQGITTCS